MRKTLICCILMCGAMLASAQYTLRVEVSNIKKLEGQVQVCLFRDGVGFLSKGKPVHCQWIVVDADKHGYAFDSLASGAYAVIAIHDLNENKDLDTNFLGIPSEPYGFSNNPSTRFGPPDFEEAAFQLEGNRKITVKLK